MHFQTWSDKAGNAPPLTDGSLTFPDLNEPPLGGEEFQTNLIMPEPTIFLRRAAASFSRIGTALTQLLMTAAARVPAAHGLFKGQFRAGSTRLTPPCSA